MRTAFIVIREGEGWAVGRLVATCNEVPVYSMTDDTFDELADATAWVERQEDHT